MQLVGVSRSARQTDTYQTDRNTKLPLYNSTRFTTPFYRNTRPTNVIAIFDGNGSRQLCRCQTAKEGCTFTEKHVSLFLRSTLISHTFLYQRTSGRPRPRLRIRPSARTVASKGHTMAHRASHPPQTIRYPFVLFDQLAQEGEAPACADLSPISMRAEERASKRQRVAKFRARDALAFRS